MANVVILGAGFGGLTVAQRLAAASDRHQVTIVDRRSHFMMGLAKLWVLVGRRELVEGQRRLAQLRAGAVRFVQAEVEAIDLENREVRTGAGRFAYDFLVVALGAEVAPEAIPGLPPEANLYDAARVPKLRDALAGVSSGTVAVMVCRAPYKCPPAPFEAAMLVDGLLRERRVRAQVDLEVTIPDAEPMPVAGPRAGGMVRATLAQRGISLRSSAQPAGVDATARRVTFADGGTLDYDHLLAVPPHRVPNVVAEAGLVDSTGWVPVDRSSLATVHERVFAVGDICAVRLPAGGMLPKAGVMAERQGEVVAANLLEALEGRLGGGEFDGSGECFFELGDGQALRMEGHFFRPAADRVDAGVPSAEALAAKERFERERLERWFG
jgi:sulfide:quinone oxidoreductase